MSTTISAASSAADTTEAATTDASGLAHYYGLASGLDVDTIVKGLMTNDQNLLDKAKQTQQTLEWQQTAYQSVTTSLRNFESAYLSLTGGSTMLSAGAYAQFTGASSDPSLSVSGTSSATPGRHTVKIYQSAVAASVTGKSVSPAITGTADARAASLGGTSFSITADGVTKTLSFADGENYSLSALNDKLAAAFGTDPSGSCKVEATDDGSGHVSLQAGGGYQTILSVSSGPAGADALSALGIADGASNRIGLRSSGSTLSSVFGSELTADADGNFTVKVNGADVKLSLSDSLSDALQAINSANAGVSASYDSLADTVTVTSTEGGAAGKVTLDDNGTGFFTALLGADGERQTAAGRDAIVSVDGARITRNSNSFTVNGLQLTLNDDVAYTADPSAITVTLTSDVDTAVTNVENFVNAYNQLLTDINNQVYTKPDSSYAPLTSAQQSKMTSDEIDQWNAQAQKGLLFDDPVLLGISNDLRETMGAAVTTSDGKSVTLSDIGITTGSYDENGQLHVDESTLRAALQQDPQAVRDLFSKSSSIPYSTAGSNAAERTASEGLCYRLQDLCNNATGLKGSLIQMAGMPNESSATNNSLYDQLQQISDKIQSYTEQYKADQTKYYNQFTQLEVYLQQMNQQSSWISSMVSSDS